MVEKTDYLVAGGGLAGLTAGAALPDAVVLEKDAVPGGLLRSPVVNGFTIDLLPHVFFTASQEAIRYFENAVGQGRFHLSESDVRVFSHGALTRFPFQCCLFGLPPDVIVECVYEFAEALAHRREDAADFHEYAVGSFGRGIVNHFMDGYNRKLWGCRDLHELTTDWVGGKVVTLAERDVVEGAFLDRRYQQLNNAMFRYPKLGGIQAFSDGVAARVPGLKTSADIVEIDLDARRVVTASGGEFAYGNLVYALPLHLVGTLCPSAPDEVRAATARLRYRDVVALHYGVKRERITDWHWMYYPEPEYPFYRLSFPGNMGSATVPPGCSSIIAEVACNPGEPVDEQALATRCLEGMIRSRILREDDTITARAVYRLSPAYVVYDHARNVAVETIEKYLSSRGVATAGRFGKWRFFNMDHTLLSALEAARQVRSRP